MNKSLIVSVIFGLFAGFFAPAWLMATAEICSEIFVNLLRLVSLPIIFLSVVSTLSNMGDLAEVRRLGSRVVRYTCLTTVIAASVALGLFVLIQPVSPDMVGADAGVVAEGGGYLTYLLNIIPSSPLQPFLEHNVLGVLFLALLLSGAILALPKDNKDVLSQLFSSLFAAVMQMTRFILRLMPFAIWAFIALFIQGWRQGTFGVESLLLYLLCVVGANVIQATVVLPLFLWSKGISPIKTAKAMAPALTVAFFSKSSAAAMPSAMQCAEERLGVSHTVSRFSFPLCTTINMNACAGFILITVLFVSMSHGIVFQPWELIAWIFLATLAAIGNAGVPMGCYFLASAFLVAMDVPLHFLGAILPVYTMLDMLETAINIWSDACVTIVVDQDLKAENMSPLMDDVSELQPAVNS